MKKFLASRKWIIVLLLVASLALGGLYGCATSSESSAPPTSEAPPSDAPESASGGGDVTGSGGKAISYDKGAGGSGEAK